tara:strand:- start:724 stop:1494 length:771 start_codon:yes stop_codon:yes gene_type:complete
MTIDLIIEIFEINGLLYVALAALTAGIVRGFSGFGTAMIFLPVAGKYFEPVTAIIILTIMDLCGPVLIVPRALRDAYKPDLLRLIGGMIITLPIALYFLLNMETELFRYIVSILALILVFVLATGWRFQRQLDSSALIGLGGIAGVCGGIAGVPGPPVILFYMASTQPVKVIRANNLLFLFGFDIFALLFLSIAGALNVSAVVLGLILAIPMGLGNVIGAALFNPEKEKFYRKIAFCIITLSALIGLPLLSNNIGI